LIPSVNGQQAGRSRVIVTISDGERVLAQTVVVTELVHEVDPIKEITWNLVSQLMQATSAPLAAAPGTINISVGGDVSGELSVAGRDVRSEGEKSRRRSTDLFDLEEPSKAASPPAPPAESKQPVQPTFPAQAQRKSSQSWGWLLIVLIVVAVIVLIVLAVSGGWFGG
jgi:cell division protein FtsL